MGAAIEFEIVRDTQEGSNLTDRIVREVGKPDVLYYIEMAPGDTMTLHRGGKDGVVMATADPCYERQGCSKIKTVDPESTIPFEHVPSRMLGILPAKTTFSVGGTKYHWKGDTDVFEDKTDTLIAQYQPEGPGPNTGNLVMTEASDESTREIMVLSTIFMQERFEAHKHTGPVA